MAEKKKAAASARGGKRPAAAQRGTGRQPKDKVKKMLMSESGAQTDPPPGDGGG